MMASTFPTCRSNSRNLKNGLKEIQTKKEALRGLETMLKKKIEEFCQLCLKEGELTGQLPADYPLRPREPIPQVRRRVSRSNGNIAGEFSSVASVMPPSTFVSEETKPFQMSDFYKYSSKFRQKPEPGPDVNMTPALPEPANQSVPTIKTTRQLQEEASKAKNYLKHAAYDDQIEQSRKLIKRSGQKLLEATAKAIAGNPSLAEQLNNILPNPHRQQHNTNHHQNHLSHNYIPRQNNTNNNSHLYRHHSTNGERY